jgi:undecaprenyl-diphosphatase
MLYLIIVFICTDQVTSSFMKPFFERLRPCHEFDHNQITLLASCGGKYGFASGHAANTMGLAIGVLFLFKKNIYTLSLVFWAVAVGYSRIFIGVHYPGDVLAGFLLGWLISFFWYKLFQKWANTQSKLSPFLK